MVVIADEFIYAFDQGEFCRHPVTVSGTDFVVYHAGEGKPEAGCAVSRRPIFFEPFAIGIADDQSYIIFPFTGDHHTKGAERNHKNRRISVPHRQRTPHKMTIADPAFDFQLRFVTSDIGAGRDFLTEVCW